MNEDPAAVSQRDLFLYFGGMMAPLILSLFILVPSFALAGVTSADVVQKLDCKLLRDGQVVKEHSEYMMTIRTEEAYAKFSQIQFGDDSVKIQYQLLIEDDLSSKAEGSLIFLQNLMVGDKESSQEFSGQKVNWVRATNEGVAVHCELPEPVQ